MSSSPKYTVVVRDRARIAAERAAHRQRMAERAARRAEREQAARARAAQQAEQALQRERAVIAARLREASAIAQEANGGAEALRDLLADIARAEHAAVTTMDIAGSIRKAESLRARGMALRAAGLAGIAGPGLSQRLISDLRERIAAVGPDAARLMPRQHVHCTELVDRLSLAEGVRFEALYGTVEHEVARYVSHGTEAVQVARAAVGEAEGRLASAQATAESVLEDARALADHELAGELASTLRAATAAVAAASEDLGTSGTALAEVTRLEELLPRADARLDELLAAYERRADLAAALKGVLNGQGMSFLGSTDMGDRFVLSFQRPDGGVYTAAVDDDGDSDLLLSYSIDGEPDIAVPPDPAGATCDQTEAFLESLHARLADAGYSAGQLQWEGKPAAGDSPGQAWNASRRRTVPRTAAAARRISRELR